MNKAKQLSRTKRATSIGSRKSAGAKPPSAAAQRSAKALMAADEVDTVRGRRKYPRFLHGLKLSKSHAAQLKKLMADGLVESWNDVILATARGLITCPKIRARLVDLRYLPKETMPADAPSFTEKGIAETVARSGAVGWYKLASTRVKKTDKDGEALRNRLALTAKNIYETANSRDSTVTPVMCLQAAQDFVWRQERELQEATERREQDRQAALLREFGSQFYVDLNRSVHSLNLERPELVARVLHPLSDAQLIRAMAVHRGGTLGAVMRAQLLVIAKSEDYNQAGGAEADAINASRDEYFPFGLESHVQMLHVKTARLKSLALKARRGGAPNHEGVKDTALDLINYASFLVEWLERAERTGNRDSMAVAAGVNKRA